MRQLIEVVFEERESGEVRTGNFYTSAKTAQGITRQAAKFRRKGENMIVLGREWVHHGEEPSGELA